MNLRMLTLLILGFSSGLPLMLTSTTLQAWLAKSQIDLAIIGQFALAGLPYTLKFIWSPLVDSVLPTYLGKLGRRRGWAIASQLGLIASTCAMAFADPTSGIGWFAFLAILVAFFSATQDIVLDALKIEILRPEEMGAGASIFVTGYRLAILVSGAAALGMADHMPWRSVYLIMATIQLIGVITVLMIKEPENQIQLVPNLSVRERILNPFIEFFTRAGAMEILLFVMIYKLGTMMATSLTTAFLIHVGFTLTQIGAVTKVFGLIATIVGALAGGALMTKLGIKRSLWIFGFLQTTAGLSFLLLTQVGANMGAMINVIVFENFMLGMGVAAISGFMMKVCSRQFTGTQFALLSSVNAIARVILVSPAGQIAKEWGWPMFFIISVFLGIPGLLLLTRYDTWEQESPQGSTHRLTARDGLVMALFLGSLLCVSIQGFLPSPDFQKAVVWLGAICLVSSLTLYFLKQRSIRMT